MPLGEGKDERGRRGRGACEQTDRGRRKGMGRWGRQCPL